MASRPAQKERARAARQNGGPPRQPKAGSPSQREMIERLATRVMAYETSVFDIDLEMAAQGHSDTDLATKDGRKVMSEDGEDQVTYKEWKAKQREMIGNLEASFPALMPAVRKMIRRVRKEQDAQE